MTTPRDTHQTLAKSHRPLRLRDLLPVRLTARGRRPLRVLRIHGTALQATASALTDDQALAERLVILAITANSSGEEDPRLRELSTSVVIEWLGSGAVHGSSERGPRRSSGSSLLDDVHALPDDQRALLALCKFGGHTYREAALVLGLDPGRAAALLGEALRSLGTPRSLSGPQALTA